MNLSFEDINLGNESHLVLIPVDNQADIGLASIAEHKGETLRSFKPCGWQWCVACCFPAVVRGCLRA